MRLLIAEDEIDLAEALTAFFEKNQFSVDAVHDGMSAYEYAASGGYDAVIILGSVIRGDTPHFDYICQGVTSGIARLNTTSEIPIIYGLLTTNDLQQAKDRCGGRYGNKGDECAIDAIKMAKF